MKLTNDEFLRELDRRGPEGQRIWTASFSEDPKDAGNEQWRGAPYDPAKARKWDASANAFFSICTVRPGAMARREDTFGALVCVVLDDIGTKIPISKDRPPPTWAFETSMGNYQCGYILTEPITDIRIARRLIGGLVDGKHTDSGAGQVIRYARLPVGANTKSEHIEANSGNPPATRIAKWNPQRIYTAAELAESFDFDLTRSRGRPKTDPTKIAPEDDPFLAVFRKLDMLTGKRSAEGWYGMLCPWEEDHTVPDNNGLSCAYKPGGGWRCLHGHCREKHFSDVIEWLRNEHGIDVDVLLGRMPGAAGAVLRGMRRYVYSKDVKAFVDRETGAINQKEALDDFFFNASGGASYSKLLLIRDDTRRVERTTFRPGAPKFLDEGGLSAINQWCPGPVTPAATVDKRRIMPWLDHLVYIFPERADQRLVLDFLTHIVQRRGVKINWGLVLLAREQGTGRDTLVTPIRKILGDYNVAHVEGAHLESQFNDHLISEFVFVSELDTGEASRRKIYQILKGPIARPPDMVRVNIKNIPARDMPKIANFLFLTNDPAALAIDEGDRRLAVIETQRTKAEIRAYGDAGTFRDLHAMYREPGWLENFHRFLLDRKISPTFDAEGRAPETAAKMRMQRAAEPLAKTRLREWRDDRSGPLECDLVELTKVQTALSFARVGEIPISLLQMFLRDLGAEYIKQVRIGDDRVHLWAVRDVARYMMMAQEPGALAEAFKKQAKLDVSDLF